MECQRADEPEVQQVLARTEFRGRFATTRSAYWAWFAFVVRKIASCAGKGTLHAVTRAQSIIINLYSVSPADATWVDCIETKCKVKKPSKVEITKRSAPQPVSDSLATRTEHSSVGLHPLTAVPESHRTGSSSSSLSSPYSMAGVSPVPAGKARDVSEDDHGWVVEMEGVDQAPKFPAGAAPAKQQ